MKPLPLDRNCFVTSVTLVFLKKFGLDALDWDPIIVRDAFEEGFGFKKMPQRMFDKLNCGLSLIGTSLYTTTIEGFLTGTACMNNLVLGGNTAPYVDFEQCSWGIWEYANLNGDIDDKSHPTEEFSPDIIKYIQDVGARNGITAMPVWMDFAEPEDTSSMPDMGEDVDLFNQYMQRQQEYREDMTRYVLGRQELLKLELQKLADQGFLA